MLKTIKYGIESNIQPGDLIYIPKTKGFSINLFVETTADEKNDIIKANPNVLRYKNYLLYFYKFANIISPGEHALYVATLTPEPTSEKHDVVFVEHKILFENKICIFPILGPTVFERAKPKYWFSKLSYEYEKI